VLIFLGAAAIALFGIQALVSLPLRSSPIIPYNLIDIGTFFPGADPQTVDRFVTLPLESAISAQPGIGYVTGSSGQYHSDIQAVFGTGANVNTVFANILATVNAARINLPAAVEASTLTLVGDDNANQELNITLEYPAGLSRAKVTQLAYSEIVPRLETLPGMGPIQVYSGTPSLHVTLDPIRMQAFGVTPTQITQTLTDAAQVNGAGSIRNSANVMPAGEANGLTSPDQFSALPVATRNGVNLPLRSVAASDVGFFPGSDFQWWNDQPAITVAAGIAPSGNIIQVADAARALVAQMQSTMPPGVTLAVTYDESINVRESLKDLTITLILTILLVGVIVRLSLGTMRAALAPLTAISLSLLGAALVMQLTGQSLNIFTIIALVLAVGLVVDDAIVVVEDVFRRVAEGAESLQAAEASISRLAPVLAAISSTLVVAFLPLGFLSGLTAALFRPFALVLISAFVLSLGLALTVVPWMAMWASRTYHHSSAPSLIDRFRDLYVSLLAPALRVPPLIAAGVAVVALGCFSLLHFAPINLLPAANGLNVDIYASAPNGASIGYVMAEAAKMEKILHKTLPGQPEWLVATEGGHALFGGYEYKSPEDAAHYTDVLTKALGGMDGVAAYVSQENGIPGSGDLPVSILISGQTSASRLLDLATRMQNDANASGDFNFVQITPGQPQYQYEIGFDHKKAAALGLGDADISNAIAALSGGTLGQVSVNGSTMKLFVNMPGNTSLEALRAIPVRNAAGTLIPLGTLITVKGGEKPNALGSWQGLPAVNIQAQQANGVALSTALAELRGSFDKLNHQGVSFGYSGPSETYRESNAQNTKLFGLGLLGLFFLLAAQFRSLRDPFVVITTVPLASLGPLVLFCSGGATLNIVTEISLLTVWGLIARQGILFVQVAHEGRAQKMEIREAALRAAKLRFRPILMITLALIGGAIPLMLATGPEAVIRYDLGVVLATGMSSGFLLSLFAIPAMYCLLHGRHEV
jgi:multidrug efflux pump